MTYVAHPYASVMSSLTLSGGPSKGTRPRKPQIITASSSPSSFLNASDYSSPRSTSPSPIAFARASVINVSPLRSSPVSSVAVYKDNDDSTTGPSRDEKRDRRRGLMATENHRVAHAGLDALLRVPEVASPRAVPQPRTPQVQLVRSTTNLSVTPAIVCQPPRRTTPHVDEIPAGNGNESDGSASSNSSITCAPLRASPSPSSGSGSASSTPTQPRTPVSIESMFDDNCDFKYPAVAPLSISKTSRTPSPASRCLPAMMSNCHSSPPPPPVKEERSAAEKMTIRKRRSRGRFSSRNAVVPRAEFLFTSLEVDTTKARCEDVEINPPTLTGVLEEFEREALRIPPVSLLPSGSTRKAAGDEKRKKAENDDEGESDWLDIPDYDADRLDDAEYYRADIASHLQLFSSSSCFPPLSRVSSCSKSGHRRIGSNFSVSSGTVSHWQLPPARPDSMPPPPHLRRSSEGQPPSLPPLPALPALPEVGHQGFLRRASASSLASTASNRSSRSNRSSGSASGRSTRRNARRSVARRSAAVALGTRRRRSSGGLGVNRPLPPIPREEINGQRQGPNAVLDPTYGDSMRESADQVKPRPSRSRPPPRFSIPMSVNEDDFGSESLDLVATVPPGGLGLMARVAEEDEDEDGLIDPFVLERYSISGSSKDNSGSQDEKIETEGVDPFTTPPQSGRSKSIEVDVPLTPSTCSPFSPNKHVQQFRDKSLILPESPAPSSTFGGESVAESSSSGETSLTFDAQSLYSSYATFSPAPSTSFASSCNSDDTNSGPVCERKESTQSVYTDSSGRPLQSRWSVSTFASVAPPNTSSSAKSFFPIPKLMSTVPSRLSARLRASRERVLQQSRERGGKDQPPAVRPFPFFPTPTPPSPKRKTNPGPGKYVPKPELMPPKEREKLGKSVKNLGSPRSSVETVKTSSASSASSTCSSFSNSTKNRERANTATSNSSQHPSSSFKAQFAQYNAHKQSIVQGASPYARTASPTSNRVVSPSFTCSSPPQSGRASLKSRSSTDSLSAFPFLIGGESLEALTTGAEPALPSASTCNVDAMNENERSRVESGGLRRKAIPPELMVALG